jgi:hypothetical protein
MSVDRVTLSLFLLFSFVQPAPALAQARENIILLPIDVSPEYANQKDLIGGALEQSLSNKYNVFYGGMVEAALQKEYSKDDCTAETCVQNIAIQFNGEVIVDASVQMVEESTFVRVKFQNVITGELEAIVQEACRQCSFAQLVSFIDAQTSNIALNSSAGLTALLEKEVQPAKQPIEPVQDTGRDAPAAPRQVITRQKQEKATGPSYWKWGLGALVLAAGGGGGGGGGSDSSGASTSTPTTTPTNVTPFDTPGREWVDGQNMLAGGHTYIEMPQADHTRFYGMIYRYGGNGSFPSFQNLGIDRQTYEAANGTAQNNLFRFQVEGREIKRFAILDEPDYLNFDVADGASIRPHLDEMENLSYFTNEDGDEFLGLSLTLDNQVFVNGIARSFFGVVEYDVSQRSDYDRRVLAYHSGQPAPDARVPTSGIFQFVGYSAGQWVPHNDVSYWTTSVINVNVNFDSPGDGAELVSFNTHISANPGVAGSWQPHSTLNFSVEGGVRDGPKRIGAVSTDSENDALPRLSDNGQAEGGAWTAFFYEEFNAVETSGAFTFHRDDGDRGDKYIGAFGARRQ